MANEKCKCGKEMRDGKCMGCNMSSDECNCDEGEKQGGRQDQQ